VNVRLTVCVAATILAAFGPAGRAQEKVQKDEKAAMEAILQKAEEEYRLYFARPEKVAEYWAAMKFEIRLGKFDLAALHLKGIMQRKPAEEVDKELLKIEEAEGMAPFLALQTIRKWSEFPAFQKEAEKNVNELINRVTAALEKYLGDPKRINLFIKQLDAPTIEERTFAMVQLKRAQTRAVPYLIKALQDSTGKPAGRQIIEAMVRLGPEIVPAFLEVLKARNAADARNLDLRLALLEVIERRADKRAIPYLWHLSSSNQYPAAVQSKARHVLAYLTETSIEHLPEARAALAELSEKYYRHQVKYPDNQLKIWGWDGQTLASQPVVLTPRQAEEYFGLRYAREALELDPAYQPAQIVFLALMLEHRYAQALDKAVFQPALPDLQRLLATVDSDLLMTLLERGFRDNNPRIALAVIETLGQRGETRAARVALDGRPQGIVRALYYPDRRVQFAAVRAMLRMPPSSVPAASARVVEILRRFLAAESQAKALVAFTPRDHAAKVRQAVKEAGFRPVLVGSAKDMFEQLKGSADFDAVLLFPNMPAEELPYLLTQLRRDSDVGRLPLLIFTDLKRQEWLSRAAGRFANTWVYPAVLATTSTELKNTLESHIAGAAGAKLSDKERKQFARAAMDYFWRMVRGEIHGYDVRPAHDAIVFALRDSDLVLEAIETLGRLPGTDNQQHLAGITLDKTRGKLRLAAAKELNRHIQRFGLVLMNQQIKDILIAFNNPAEDAELRGQLGLVVGSLPADARLTGTRLHDFQPPPPAPPKK
jgi:hypothetical protein